jgi:MinD-like ATPase involved in chromosome partitioning or flagellar assembly
MSDGVKFHQLPGITGLSRWPEITPSAIEALVESSSQNYDLVVFDLSSSLEPALRTEASALHRNELTRHLVANCDDLIMVAGADPISTHRALRQIGDALKLHGEVGFHLVINRLRSSVLGANPSRQLQRTYVDLVKRVPNHYLPDEPKLLDEALRYGLPVRLVRRSSVYLKSVRALTALLGD